MDLSLIINDNSYESYKEAMRLYESNRDQRNIKIEGYDRAFIFIFVAFFQKLLLYFILYKACVIILNKGVRFENL